MTLPLYDTLGTMIDSVLAEAGLGVQGLSSDLKPQIVRYLQKAQKRLWMEYRFMRARTRIDVPLIVGQAFYDLPDAFDAGSIDTITATSVDGRNQWKLVAGIAQEDRARSAYSLSDCGEPSRYDVFEGRLEVIKPPTATGKATKLILEGYLGPAVLTEDEDRPTVDSEAMVMLAAIDLKSFKKQSISPQELAAVASYIEGCQNRNAVARPFTMGTGYLDPKEVRNFARRRWFNQRRP